MDLHLDDRLLHGRILHSWAERLGPARWVLVSQSLAEPELASIYSAAAEATGAFCLVCSDVTSPPPPMTDDFWLTDDLALVRRLMTSSLGFSRLIVIGLRESEADWRLGDFRLSEDSRRQLEELSQTLPVELRPFPSAPSSGLADLSPITE